MNAHRMDFDGAVSGANIASEALAVEAVVMGQETDPMHVAESLGKGARDGKLSLMSVLAATKTAIPGGRPKDQIKPELLEGREDHNPIDWTEERPGLI